jgi:hypothetical protein
MVRGLRLEVRLEVRSRVYICKALMCPAYMQNHALFPLLATPNILRDLENVTCAKFAALFDADSAK